MPTATRSDCHCTLRSTRSVDDFRAPTATFLSAIGPLAERVVVAATHNQGIVLAGGYAEMAFRGEISRLLDTDAGEAG